MPKINDFFVVKKGMGAYREQLAVGQTPLISATNFNNGVNALVEHEPIFKAPAITVERVTGQAFVQLIDFITVPDDLAVLVPRKEVSLEFLYSIASQINLTKWRYSYGRKLTPPRIENIEIQNVSLKKKVNLDSYFPKKHKKILIKYQAKFSEVPTSKFFNIERGDFHAIDQLDSGNTPTVSRTIEDNGVVGYFEIPENAKTYPKGTITVSTVSGHAFLQLRDFIATDNVLILSPQKKLNLTTLFFIAVMLNRERWRFSYGRQAYKRVFDKSNIFMPMKTKDEIDEKIIEKIMLNCYGWKAVERILCS